MGRLSGRWYAVPRRLLLAGLAAVLVTAAIVMAQGVSDQKAEARKARIDLIGGGATMVTARELDIKEIGNPAAGTAKTLVFPRRREKVLDPSSLVVGPSAHMDPRTDEPPTSPKNSAVRYFPNVSENEPTVVVNPKNSKRLVAGTHFIGDTANRCVAHYSRDGGKTWSDIPIFMPQLSHSVDCSDPVLAYAPDGSRVYYAYMDIDFATTYKILVSYSEDDGKSWSNPVVALSHPAADYDKPWIGTHVPTGGSQSNKNFVYVSATRFDFANTAADCHIDFARSSNKGASWSPAQVIESGNCSSPGVTSVVQGSRPTGGVGSDVLVAWYNSDVDGFQVGRFNIKTRYSADNGATFAPVVVAATDTFELSMWLGPAIAYHRWWGGMFPDVEIAPNGSGHILYTHDPQPGSTIEDGNIRYLGSVGRPYATWSAPATVNDDPAMGKAQGWATLEATSNGNTTTLYALWEDHRNSAVDNRNYDIFWSKKMGSGAWSTNQKLNDVQSISDFIFLGDYFDIAIADGDNDGDNDLVASDDDDGNGVFVYGIWTDRRPVGHTVFDFDDDIWGSRLPPKSMSSGNGDDD